ncbi:ultraviolet-b receptor uvr8 [Phtheirospermum japonicum]|uniref:Ultraviolet-b receptor uvr8 n=1 Tax=Phtheirospermum japonicum TaxID=374723 RepID=A0A830BYF1_9LAMI|nr:ultraviolet-b receptor uvr8 [Phtheirospermum japonicum]
MEQEQKTVQENDQEQHQEIWSWGAGTDGQLATGKLQDEHSPKLLRSLSAVGPPITLLSCGGAHAIAVISGGRVLTWGRGSSGQLGHGEMVNSLQPKFVKAFEGFVVTYVAAGWNHSGFISDSGAIFTCGDGSFGQLGHGDYKSQCSPQEVSYFGSKQVEQVACGMRHSLVLLRGNVENQVYGFGSGKRGQLGISTDKVKSTSLPQITMGLTNLKIVNISANGDHSAALSGEGKLFMLGGNRHGALGDSQKTSSMNNVSENGSIMTWGWGEHGQLGLGDTNDQTAPRVVSLGRKFNEERAATSRVYCGSGFSFVLRTYDVGSVMR